jgi:hypothetical protein
MNQPNITNNYQNNNINNINNNNNNNNDTLNSLVEHIYNYPSNTNLPSPQHIKEGTDLGKLHPNCSDKATSPDHTLYCDSQDLQANAGSRNHHIDNMHHRQQEVITNNDNNIYSSRDSTSHATHNDNSIHTHPIINLYTQSVSFNNFTDNSAVNNYPDNCINEQPSITITPHASDPVSPASKVTTCAGNNHNHRQDDSNCPFMHLRDNNINNNNSNNNNNNNNTDTPNLICEHIHPNINQYTQSIRFNNVIDNIYDTIINTTKPNRETLARIIMIRGN